MASKKPVSLYHTACSIRINILIHGAVGELLINAGKMKIDSLPVSSFS